MTMSNLDADQVIKSVYDEASNCLKTSPANTLVKEAYDYVGATYPDGVTEVYAYKSGGSGGTLIATVTIVYTDATKAFLSSMTVV